jgi:probable rRNA maturation factor
VVDEGKTGASAQRLGRWLARIAPRTARGSVSIAILPDAKVKALNQRYRGVNKATDVLSFPAETAEKRSGSFFADGGRKRIPISFLGDIVIARGVAARQARDIGHSVATELRVLTLHGLLHLLGYDHEADNGRMARAEARLRRRAGLPLGLIARTS